MTSRKSTAPVQPEPVTVTAACEVGRCHVCRGTVISLTVPVGQQCQHGCHGGDDLRIERGLEVAHWGGRSS